MIRDKQVLSHEYGSRSYVIYDGTDRYVLLRLKNDFHTRVTAPV